MRLRTTNADEINIRLKDTNISLGTTCHRSKLFVASCSLTGPIYSLVELNEVVLGRIGCLWIISVM